MIWDSSPEQRFGRFVCQFKVHSPDIGELTNCRYQGPRRFRPVATLEIEDGRL
jgi:hypothetical protein